ncbi:MAG TPA: endolytic transglycosylase MltG [Methylocella sp.]|nr:endolytic transglycosylase MltG [Methylocella sp.]
MPFNPNGTETPDPPGKETPLTSLSERPRVTPRSPKEALQPDAPPPPPIPPSRRRPGLSAFSGFLSFLLIAAIAALAALAWGEHRMREPGPLTASKVVYISPGTEVADIIAELEREGVVDSPFLLNMALLVEGNRSKVKSGEYLFKQNASLREVIDTLVSGKQVLHAITIPEGLTSEQIVERLRESDILVGEIIDLPKEGSLLPETYKFARGTPRADIVKKMQDDQKRAVDLIWARRASGLPLRSPYELITLASIVEKETGKADERPRVASVFLNRLKKGMRLQSDPTIVYGLVGGKGSLGRGITQSELEKFTPYNTYLIDGLPPGPIANPGRAALEAVANPSRTQDLYFVADGTGGHVFSESLDQHSRNVQRWRQLEKEARDRQLQQAVPDAGKAAPETLKSEPQGAPPPPAAPGGGRKSEFGTPGSVYGALPAPMVDAQNAARSLTPFSHSPAEAAITGALAGIKAKNKLNKTRPGEARASAYTFGPGLDELGISLGGMAPAAILDGPEGDENETETLAAGGMTPGLRGAGAKMAGEERLSRTAAQADSQEAPIPPQAAQAAPAGSAPRRAHAFDASAGTPFDPLKNKTYDLNYPKTVPVIR